jgi:hypothetical protein
MSKAHSLSIVDRGSTTPQMSPQTATGQVPVIILMRYDKFLAWSIPADSCGFGERKRRIELKRLRLE